MNASVSDQTNISVSDVSVVVYTSHLKRCRTYNTVNCTFGHLNISSTCNEFEAIKCPLNDGLMNIFIIRVKDWRIVSECTVYCKWFFFCIKRIEILWWWHIVVYVFRYSTSPQVWSWAKQSNLNWPRNYETRLYKMKHNALQWSFINHLVSRISHLKMFSPMFSWEK